MAAHTWEAIAASIAHAIGEPFLADSANPIGGGCINRGFHLKGHGRDFFVKLNAASALAMFEAEAAGLREIAATSTVRVPLPVCTGSDPERAWLALEYLPLSSDGQHAMAALGERLAALHRVTSATFGWTRGNTIGSTLQVNTPLPEWSEFWVHRRLGYQLDLADRSGYRGVLQRKGELLLERVPSLLAGHRPAASLVHGDLWGGNAAAIAGEPVIFDPAVYYGDREVDLAMTRLFGGFPSEFYSAYENAWPLEHGHRERRDLYNLYHVLNHLNLFGGGYLRQALQMIDRLLAAA